MNGFILLWLAIGCALADCFSFLFLRRVRFFSRVLGITLRCENQRQNKTETYNRRTVKQKRKQEQRLAAARICDCYTVTLRTASPGERPLYP
jgi:hypothetical protein